MHPTYGAQRVCFLAAYAAANEEIANRNRRENFLAAYAAANIASRLSDAIANFLAAYAAANMKDDAEIALILFLSCLRGSEQGIADGNTLIKKEELREAANTPNFVRWI